MGVLSPITDRLPSGYITHAGAYNNYVINPEHGVWLRELAEVFDLVWATAREEEANLDVGPALGLPVLPVISFAGLWDSERTWKLDDVAAYVGNRPFCWIDDDLFDDAQEWALHRQHPTLLLAADPRVGFTALQRAAMIDFATSVSGS